MRDILTVILGGLHIIFSRTYPAEWFGLGSHVGEKTNKTTAQHGFSVPDPPSNAKREYYARLEEEQKQRNKLAYQKRHGLSE